MRRRAALLLSLLLGPPAIAADISVRTSPDGPPSVILSGPIVPGDDTAFEIVTARLPEATVVLSSYGGRVLQALNIGRRIHERGYATLAVPGQRCASACALIWLAGGPRLLAPSAEIGLHATSYAGGETHDLDPLIRRYLTSLGLADDAIWTMVNIPSASIRFLDVDELRANGIACEVVW